MTNVFTDIKLVNNKTYQETEEKKDIKKMFMKVRASIYLKSNFEEDKLE